MKHARLVRRSSGSPHRRVECFLLLLPVLVSGCVSEQAKRDAVTAVNLEFRKEYERTLLEDGTRVYAITPNLAMEAMHRILQQMGMRVETEDLTLGVGRFAANAPTPLTTEEWRQTSNADLPKLQGIARPYVGWLATEFIRFEPEGLEIVITVTALSLASGTEVSLTMRMREIEAPRSGMPRRDYPPPTGLRIGLTKIWDEFEAQTHSRRLSSQ
jgi:hypothetical protein